MNELKKLLDNETYRNRMITELHKIKDLFKGKRPSSRVASIVGELAEWNKTGV